MELIVHAFSNEELKPNKKAPRMKCFVSLQSASNGLKVKNLSGYYIVKGFGCQIVVLRLTFVVGWVVFKLFQSCS